MKLFALSTMTIGVAAVLATLVACGPPPIDTDCEGRCDDPRRTFCSVEELCVDGRITEYTYQCVPYLNPDEGGCARFPDDVCVINDDGLAVVLYECQ